MQTGRAPQSRKSAVTAPSCCRLRTRVRGLEREIPRNRQAALPKRGALSDISRHLVDEAIALNKYGCSHDEIAERLRLKEAQVLKILENPQRAREDASF